MIAVAGVGVAGGATDMATAEHDESGRLALGPHVLDDAVAVGEVEERVDAPLDHERGDGDRVGLAVAFRLLSAKKSRASWLATPVAAPSANAVVMRQSSPPVCGNVGQSGDRPSSPAVAAPAP